MQKSKLKNQKSEALTQLDLNKLSLSYTPSPIGRGRIDILSFFRISWVRAVVIFFGIACSACAAPVISFNHFTNDVSTDNQPTITGIATDQASAIVSIECRVDGGAWTAATPIDGQFNSNTEAFSWVPPQPLTRGVNSHEVEARGFSGSYNFYIIGDRPEIGLQLSGTNIINGDVIGKNPSFSITIISNQPPLTAQSTFLKDGAISPTTQNLTLTVDPNNAYILRANYAPTLDDGKYDIKIEAIDSNNQTITREVIDLMVQATADLAIQGTPLNYPNPFNPETGSTNISYTLSKPADITLTIHDLTGSQILKKNYTTGAAGGSAGYNEVAWDGRDAGGNMVGNGIYIYLIVGEGRLLAKGKATVLK